jgi:hypothetical protein
MKKILLLLPLLLAFPLASADRGMVIIDPPNVVFTESGQQAIIAWDGQEEVLLLSTDVSSSEPARVLEVLPVPSNVTEVKEGSIESFRTLVRLINSKLPSRDYPLGLGKQEENRAPGVEIQFHQRIGPHEVMIVKVNDADYFKYWVRDFAFSRNFTYSEISTDFRKAITDYIERDIRFFIFDVISTNQTRQSVSPLMYRFRSDCLYYPMKITSASNVSDSYSSLDLFLLSGQGTADREDVIGLGLYPEAGFTDAIKLKRSELEEVAGFFGQLLPDGAYAMKISYDGPFKQLTSDLMLKKESFTKPGSTPWVGPDPSRPQAPNYALPLLAIAGLVLMLFLIRPRR